MKSVLELSAMVMGMVFGYLAGLSMLPKWFYLPRWRKGGRDDYREMFREWDLAEIYEDGYKDGARDYVAVITMCLGGALAAWLARLVWRVLQQFA